ncbi:MAG TPA: ABC transporter permease [Solirubrobacter sp.]|nr:ABC transporter permease [Solirubrobacter sp.]
MSPRLRSRLGRLRRSYALRRVAVMIPQLFGITLVVFVLLRLFPGDPAYLFAGPTASPETIARIRHDLGLDEPIVVQYLHYLRDLLHGNLGTSLVTSQPVRTDMLERFPATLELITAALLIALAVGIPLGALGARKPRGVADRATRSYGLLAGSLPDFWWGLMLIFIFFTTLDVAAAPVGRLDIGFVPPDRITGFYTVDSLLTGNWATFTNAVSHLILPAFTLAFVYGGPIVKHMRASMTNVLDAPYLAYGSMCGLSRWTLFRYALRNALVPAVTMTGITYAYLIGGAVLVETVFSWGGLGQYAVRAITSSDYLAVSGTVLTTTVFALVVYAVLDLVYVLIDPRIRYSS